MRHRGRELMHAICSSRHSRRLFLLSFVRLRCVNRPAVYPASEAPRRYCVLGVCTRRMSSAHVVFAFRTFILRSAPVNVSLVRYLAAPLYRWQPSLNPAYSLSSREISLQSAGEHQFPHRAKGIGDQAMHSPFRPSIRQCLFDIILTLLDPSQNSCSRAKPCCWSILWSCLCSP